MTTADATRLAGEAYRTRVALGKAATPGDMTRIAQEGYQSRLARSATGGQPDTGEYYKVGEKIGGRYEVSAIHHGELGVVYGCFDHQTKLPRALKTVRARHANDKQVLSMFESEATVWIALEKHPYIVRAYLVERFGNLPYVITEYIRGEEGMEGDLRGWLGHPSLTLPVAVAMALQIAQGMQHAVRKVPNLVHRDLKPANILVNGDRKAMVTDFGLVHATQSGAGTPAYMSPEQWRAQALDAQSDIYSYGCILFEMFTAHRLFSAFTEREWEKAHLENAPVELARLVPGLPDAIDQFVRHCLAKDPVARPQSWDEIVEFFAELYHRLTGKAVVLDFSSLALDAGEWLDASYSLSNLRRYDEMLIACDRALQIDPNLALGWSNRSFALTMLGRYKEAMQVAERALAISPGAASLWRVKAFVLEQLNRNDEAIQAYDRALAIDPGDASLWRFKAHLLEKLNRDDEAIQVYDRALAVNPGDASMWNIKGNVLDKLGRYDEAIQAFDRALALNPEDADGIWMSKGMSFGGLKRYGDQVMAYDRAFAINPESLGWRDLKEDVLSSIQCTDEVIQAYDQALAIEPDNAGMWCDKGNALDMLKRYNEAIHAYDQALTIDSNRADRWRFKGNALYKLSCFEESIQAYNRALAINQNDMLAWNSKGHALTWLKRFEESFNAYYCALTLDPNRSSAHENRTTALQLSTLSVGSTVKGIVKKINNRGATVDIGFVDGWLAIANIAWRRLKHPSEVLSVGDEVQVKILTFDQEKNGVGLGMKQLGEDPWMDVGRRFPIGTHLSGKVSALTECGTSVEIEAGIEGLVHVSDMNLTAQNLHPSRVMQVGEQVEVMILETDEKRRHISLGMKQCTPHPQGDSIREMKKGDELAEGKRYEEAVAAYGQALDFNPDDAHAWYKKGDALLRLERYDEALLAFDHASSLDSKGEVSFAKGFALQKLKRYEESISACDRALALNPSLGIAQETKDFALQELKRHEVASSIRRPQSFWRRFWNK